MKTAIPTPETDANKFAVRYSISEDTMVVSYLFAEDLERQRNHMQSALKAIHEAGRMSDQPRAVYCSLIAEDALIAAGNRTAIESRWNKGEALFAVHEMDEEPTPITSLDMLNAYSPDQVYAAAPDLLAALEQCLPFVDRIRASSGGDGNLTALNARAAISAAKGGAQ